MTIHEASRTLLKSPPELWSECSDAASLSRHLDQFGEIKITRLEPETTVAWEGNRISGTVRLEPSGWGTRVILTAEEAEVPDLPPPAPPAQATEHSTAADSAVEPELPPATGSDMEPELPAATGSDMEPELPAATGSDTEPKLATTTTESDVEHAPLQTPRSAPEPVVARAARQPGPATDPAPPASRKGLFARFVAKMRGDVAELESTTPPTPSRPAEPEASVESQPDPAPEPRPEPQLSRRREAGPQPAPSLGPQPPLEPQPAPELEPAAEPEPPPPASATATPAATESALKDALESLGMAHHRPFSRG